MATLKTVPRQAAAQAPEAAEADPQDTFTPTGAPAVVATRQAPDKRAARHTPGREGRQHVGPTRRSPPNRTARRGVRKSTRPRERRAQLAQIEASEPVG